ncbi:MAG TPA: methyltransferase domain-containing protein [Planctomycetota bacterium]|jgi:SAM-dependent methyltransferase|nr:methyltransferase domain-containing protein [Planctomycetota bacterium]
MDLARLPAWALDLITCPGCGGALEVGPAPFSCPRCSRSFPVVDGIPVLFVPTDRSPDARDVTEIVKAFYEENPFPNYDSIDSVATLMAKAREGLYARLLDEQIPSGARVLDLGCGTGQLANFLSLANRTVIGSDLCLHSLRLGSGFAASQGLRRVAFLQMNLFRPALRPGSFHVVLCNGVLHHTSDPEGGFRSLLGLAMPGGFVVIGLYNRLGRLMTDLRRVVFRATGRRLAWLDPYLRGGKLGAAKSRAWWMDQYHHPHESEHTMGDVLRWFDAAGVEFVSGIPPFRPSDPFDESYRLFRTHLRGTRFDRARAQARLVRTGNREGGFFIAIGRKLRG